MKRAMLVLLAVLACAGCLKKLDAGSRVIDTRILGARVTPAGDGARSSPVPGEASVVSLLVAEPVGMEDARLAWGFVVCPRAPGGTMPGCAGTPSLVTGTGVPTSLAVPPPADAVTQSLLLGVVCTDGTPTLDAATMSPACSPGTTKSTELFFVVVTAPDAATANRHPTLGDDALTLAGGPWLAPPTTVPATGCAAGAPTDGSLPVLSAAAGKVTLRTVVDAADRESFTAMVGDPPVPTPEVESLQLAHFATAGDMERQFAVLGGADALPAGGLGVDWTPPAAVDAGGTLVRFWITVRDLRGGFDHVERAVCVTP